MQRKKTGGRKRMFHPHEAVKVVIFVPANDEEGSKAAAVLAVKQRYESTQ